MSNPCCPQNDGTNWHTPIPGDIIAVPAGSTVIATPSAGGDCPCQSDEASGIVASGSQSPTSTGFEFPSVLTAFDVPAIGSNGQLYSSGASKWAAPGLTLWLPTHSGYLAVVGVNGDLITFKNSTIPQGTTINQGTPLIPAAPANSTNSDPQNVTELDAFSGLNEGSPVLMGGTVGDILWHGASKWKRVSNSPLFRFLSGMPTLLDVKRDVVASSHSTDKWANPVVSSITGLSPSGTITFPQFPTLEAGQTIRALVQVNWKFAVKTSADTLRVKVTINGVEWQAVAYCAGVAGAATSANAANFSAEMNNKGPQGSAWISIPVPADNSPVNVSVEARKAGVTTSPLDANSHYVVNMKIVGYWY